MKISSFLKSLSNNILCNSKNYTTVHHLLSVKTQIHKMFQTTIADSILSLFSLVKGLFDNCVFMHENMFYHNN